MDVVINIAVDMDDLGGQKSYITVHINIFHGISGLIITTGCFSSAGIIPWAPRASISISMLTKIIHTHIYVTHTYT